MNHRIEGATKVSQVDLRLWGKSRGLPRPYPLILHLLDAAAAVGALWRDYLTPAHRGVITRGLGLEAEEHAAELLALWAGLHDLGKLIPGFQALDPAAWNDVATHYPDLVVGEALGHDRASQLALAPLLAARGYPTSGTAGWMPGPPCGAAPWRSSRHLPPSMHPRSATLGCARHAGSGRRRLGGAARSTPRPRGSPTGRRSASSAARPRPPPVRRAARSRSASRAAGRHPAGPRRAVTRRGWYHRPSRSPARRPRSRS